MAPLLFTGSITLTGNVSSPVTLTETGQAAVGLMRVLASIPGMYFMGDGFYRATHRANAPEHDADLSVEGIINTSIS